MCGFAFHYLPVSVHHPQRLYESRAIVHEGCSKLLLFSMIEKERGFFCLFSLVLFFKDNLGKCKIKIQDVINTGKDVDRGKLPNTPAGSINW